MSRSQRVFLASGLLAPLVFVPVVLAAAGQYAGYSHATQAISELAGTDAPAPWMQTANFYVTGTLVTLFAFGLSRTPASRTTAVLMGVFGVGIIVQAFAPCDVGCTFVTTTGTVHNVVGLTGFLAAIAGLWARATTAPRDAYRRYTRASAMVAMIGFACWIAFGKIAAIPAANGSLQRLFVGVLLLWCAVTAIRELRGRPDAPEPSHSTASALAVPGRVAFTLLLLVITPSITSAQTSAAEPPISFTPAGEGSLIAFMLVVAFVVGSATWGMYVATRRDTSPAASRSLSRFLVGVAVWLAAYTAWIGSGLMAARPMPSGPITLVTISVAALAFGLSRMGGRLARHLPVAALVAFQGFRLPLELVLHTWSEQGTIPVAMTWAGSNFDIVAGLTAIALAPFASRPAVAWVANLTGIVLLANVARVAIMTSPVPFGWPVEPKLMLLAYFPYSYIGPVCVAGAIAGHVVLTRKLLGRSEAPARG